MNLRDAYRQLAASHITVGARVRSFDFSTRDDCYVEGIVRGIQEFQGCNRYAIAVERVVWMGQEESFKENELVGQIVYPPVNGSLNLLTGKPTNFVKRVL